MLHDPWPRPGLGIKVVMEFAECSVLLLVFAFWMHGFDGGMKPFACSCDGGKQ